MASNPVQRKWTVAEYLAHEEAVGIRHEYLDGDIYAMSGGTSNHANIISNTFIALGIRLSNSTCRMLPSDMRIKISDSKYVYPDMSAVCGNQIYADKNRTMLTNPTLVVEVMSPSSENYDKGLKSDLYRSLPSLKGYLLLDQKQVFAQLYTRQDDGWLLREYKELKTTIPLTMLDCELPLSEVYRDITFED